MNMRNADKYFNTIYKMVTSKKIIFDHTNPRSRESGLRSICNFV